MAGTEFFGDLFFLFCWPVEIIWPFCCFFTIKFNGTASTHAFPLSSHFSGGGGKVFGPKERFLVGGLLTIGSKGADVRPKVDAVTKGGDWVGTVNCGRKDEVWPGANVCSRDDGGFKAGSKTDVGVGTVIESGTGTVLGCDISGGLLDTDGKTGGTYEGRPFRAGWEDGM